MGAPVLDWPVNGGAGNPIGANEAVELEKGRYDCVFPIVMP